MRPSKSFKLPVTWFRNYELMKELSFIILHFHAGQQFIRFVEVFVTVSKLVSFQISGLCWYTCIQTNTPNDINPIHITWIWIQRQINFCCRFIAKIGTEFLENTNRFQLEQYGFHYFRILKPCSKIFFLCILFPSSPLLSSSSSVILYLLHGLASYFYFIILLAHIPSL